MMLKIMYLFFRITCGIEGDRLPDWKAALKDKGWKENDTRLYFKTFINTSFWVS